VYFAGYRCCFDAVSSRFILSKL